MAAYRVRWLLVWGLLLPILLMAQTECLKCHGSIAAEMKKRVVHPGECETCHVDHRAMAGKRPYLKAAEPGLCLGCHEGARHDQPVEKTVCTQCHDPHASRLRGLLYESQHGPFAGRHCDECHSEPQGGQARINGGDVKQLCLSCHVVIGDQVAASKSGHRKLVCIACHTPHTSNYRPHLKKPREELCASCHKELPAGAKFSH
jgi:predicted CXXCH cytochrome family protein